MDLESRVDKLERRLDATLKLVQTGMKMLVKMQQETRDFKKETQHAINALIAAQMRTDEKLDQLAAAQKRTDAKFERLIDALTRNRGNGRHR